MKYSINALRQDFKKGKNIKYLFFWKNNLYNDEIITKACFSQWWSVKFKMENTVYSCMEQYMMAEKARLFKDNKILEEIMKTNNPKQIKVLGRAVKNFDEFVWKKNRYDIVVKGNFAKFSQSEDLKKFLLKTKNKVIVEASPYDKIWGIGMCDDDKFIENPLFWKGKNLLGFALMEVRDSLNSAKENKLASHYL